MLGRDATCDRVLDDPRVSRQHARLIRDGGGLKIEDLGSQNGTFVNGQRITAAVILRPNDVVAIGCFTFKLKVDGEIEHRDFRGNVTIEARGIAVDAGDRRLLDDVSLTVNPSEFVALMGPSGAGKTTLMNALNGYTPPSEGDVWLNGRNLYEHYAQFQGILGYVPQVISCMAT